MRRALEVRREAGRPEERPWTIRGQRNVWFPGPPFQLLRRCNPKRAIGLTAQCQAAAQDQDATIREASRDKVGFCRSGPDRVEAGDGRICGVVRRLRAVVRFKPGLLAWGPAPFMSRAANAAIIKALSI